MYPAPDGKENKQTDGCATKTGNYWGLRKNTRRYKKNLRHDPGCNGERNATNPAKER